MRGYNLTDAHSVCVVEPELVPDRDSAGLELDSFPVPVGEIIPSARQTKEALFLHVRNAVENATEPGSAWWLVPWQVGPPSTWLSEAPDLWGKEPGRSLPDGPRCSVPFRHGSWVDGSPTRVYPR